MSNSNNFLPRSLRVLIEEFSKLPGIGPKSAQRLAMYLLRQPDLKIKPLGDAVLNLKTDVVFCENCWNLADKNPCQLCSSEERDSSIICVVEDVLDTVALEKTNEFHGLYHVLHGALSPVDGIGPEQLKIQALFDRLKNSETKELILATNPSLEGETTALYISKNLHNFSGKISRIARGLPVGGDLEYADEVTLSRALKGRMEM